MSVGRGGEVGEDGLRPKMEWMRRSGGGGEAKWRRSSGVLIGLGARPDQTSPYPYVTLLPPPNSFFPPPHRFHFILPPLGAPFPWGNFSPLEATCRYSSRHLFVCSSSHLLSLHPSTPLRQPHLSLLSSPPCSLPSPIAIFSQAI